MKQISQNIRRLRKEKGMSQEQLAQALHVTRQTVSAWERGIAQPGLDVLGQIAQLLGVEPERLLYGEDSGRGRFYRGVSFWPVLGVIPMFYVMVFWVLPIPISLVAGTFTDTAIVLCGQLFLAIVMMFCYCGLKDEIRNRDYYDQTEDRENDDLE
ncbi:transcriptional repressor DicA [uncultured Flavonifractor sp.]|nr:transcriptional repressor DicA [uncultured Flavonifractor sp.]